MAEKSNSKPIADKSEHMREIANARPMLSLSCAVCESSFTARDKRARYCSNRCRQKNKYDKVRKGVDTVAQT